MQLDLRMIAAIIRLIAVYLIFLFLIYKKIGFRYHHDDDNKSIDQPINQLCLARVTLSRSDAKMRRAHALSAPLVVQTQHCCLSLKP